MGHHIELGGPGIGVSHGDEPSTFGTQVHERTLELPGIDVIARELKLDLLEDSDFELTERFDPEGNPEDAWVSFRVLRWRTDLVPPGTVRDPDQRLEDAVAWRVSQWQWVPDEAEEPDDLDDEEEAEWGSWRLRANSPIAPAAVAELLPEGLRSWVRRMTEQAVELFESIEVEEPAFTGAAARLKDELQALG
jgi:hypothetical protein